jgi:group I intron endonuclease
MPTICGVYVILNTVNGKLYVGSSVDAYRRFRAHRSLLQRGAHSNPHLQAAWSKYGQRFFEFSVVQNCNPDELLSVEHAWIQKTHCADRGTGYNICRDPQHQRHSDETRLKMSLAAKGHKRWLGRAHSAESRSRMSASRKGKPGSEVVRTLLRELMQGNQRARGTVRSAEAREATGRALRGRKRPPQVGQKISAAKLAAAARRCLEAADA